MLKVKRQRWERRIRNKDFEEDALQNKSLKHLCFPSVFDGPDDPIGRCISQLRDLAALRRTNRDGALTIDLGCDIADFQRRTYELFPAQSYGSLALPIGFLESLVSTTSGGDFQPY